jgi:Ca-activated chloride channel family protein
MSTPQVTPGLDPEIVRRIVRAHINELRSCYNQGQVKQPQLAGSITIAFEIGAPSRVCRRR